MLELKIPDKEDDEDTATTLKSLIDSCQLLYDHHYSIHTLERFAAVLVGNELAPGLDNPYCMIYGCHCYGQWFGQLGDGRAITIGEVYTGLSP